MPSLSKKGIIAVKNPYLKMKEGAEQSKSLQDELLCNYLRKRRHKLISLVDIIFLVALSGDRIKKPLTFEMD